MLKPREKNVPPYPPRVVQWGALGNARAALLDPLYGVLQLSPTRSAVFLIFLAIVFVVEAFGLQLP